MNAVISLIYSVFLKGVAIISDDNYCSKIFVDVVLHKLKESEGKVNMNIHKIHFTMNPLKHKELSKQFYAIKTSDVTLIVLLASTEYIPVILSEASNFGLIENSQVWLIPNYQDGVTSSFIPDRILVFSGVEHKQFKSYTELRTTIPKLLDAFRGNDSACTRYVFCVVVTHWAGDVF